MIIYKFEIRKNLKKTIISLIICIILMILSLTNDLNYFNHIQGVDELPRFLRGLLTGLNFDTQTLSGSFLFINVFVMFIISFISLNHGLKLGHESSGKYDILYLKVSKDKILKQKTLAYITLVSGLITGYILFTAMVFIIFGNNFFFIILSGLIMILTAIFFIIAVAFISTFITNKKLVNTILPLMKIVMFLLFFIGSAFDIRLISLLSPLHYSTNNDLLKNNISFIYILFIIVSSIGMYNMVQKKYFDIDITR